MKPQLSQALAAAVVFFFCSLPAPFALAQMQTGPVFQSGAGLSLLDPADPHYDSHLLVFTPPPPGGPPGRPAPALREALVDVHLDIRPDGKVARVDFVEGFYDNSVERMLRIPLQDAVFQPATVGGEPVRFEKLDLRILMRGGYPPGITEDMRVELTELSELVAAKDARGAQRQAENMLERQALRLFELALVEDQMSAFYAETGQIHEAILASRLATGASKPVLPETPPEEAVEFPDTFLPPDLHFDAQRRHFIVALLGNQTGEAMQVWEDLLARAELVGRQDELADLRPRVEQLETLLNSEEPVGSAIKLVNGHWDYVMSNRRIFGVTGLDGQVDYIDITCANSPKRRLPFQNDTEFQVPASWGQCRLEFEGRDGSQFNLYEYLN